MSPEFDGEEVITKPVSLSSKPSTGSKRKVMTSLENDQIKKLLACPAEGCRSKFGPKKVRDSCVLTVNRNEQPFGCPEAGCQKRFGRKAVMDCHVRLVHRKERPFPCSLVSCNKNFGSKKDMERDVRIVHHGIRPFVCPKPGCKRVNDLRYCYKAVQRQLIQEDYL